MYYVFVSERFTTKTQHQRVVPKEFHICNLWAEPPRNAYKCLRKYRLCDAQDYIAKHGPYKRIEWGGELEYDYKEKWVLS